MQMATCLCALPPAPSSPAPPGLVEMIEHNLPLPGAKLVLYELQLTAKKVRQTTIDVGYDVNLPMAVDWG